MTRRCWSRRGWASVFILTAIKRWVQIDGFLFHFPPQHHPPVTPNQIALNHEIRKVVPFRHQNIKTFTKPRFHHGTRSHNQFRRYTRVSEEDFVEERDEDDNIITLDSNGVVLPFFADNDDEVEFEAADLLLDENGLSIDTIEPIFFDLNSNQTLQSLWQNYSQSNNHDPSAVFSDVAYFYLRDELGISEELMWKITFQAGQILGLKPNVLRAKVHFLQQAMNLTTSQIRDVVQRQPALLGLSIEQNLKPTIEFLCQELDMTPHSHLQTLVQASPAILCYSISNLAAKLNFFSNTMGFSIPESRALVLAEPRLLCCGLESGLLPRLKFWKREMRIPLEQLRKIVQKNPRMLMYSLNDNLRPKLIFYLIMTLHMEPRQVLKLLLAYPHFLNYSLEEHLLPITRYFISELEYSSLEFRNLVLKCPRVMTHALYKIKHVVGYFRYELGMEASHVKRVLYQAPQIMGLSDVNLRSKVEFVRAAFALDDLELCKVLASVPTVLVCGVEQNLQPKMEYLRGVFDQYHRTHIDSDVNENDSETGGADPNNEQPQLTNSSGGGSAQLRQAFLKLPTLLVYSLEKRIRPRLELLLEAGVSPSKITVGIPMKQANFETWLQRQEVRLDRQLREKEEQTGAAIEIRIDATKSSSKDGRIVQWTRERRRK